jgi:hypothetical protein
VIVVHNYVDAVMILLHLGWASEAITVGWIWLDPSLLNRQGDTSSLQMHFHINFLRGRELLENLNMGRYLDNRQFVQILPIFASDHRHFQVYLDPRVTY